MTLDAVAAFPAVANTRTEPGTIIGRYVVLAKLGAGAMGVVWAAYDPELDRKVALKLLAGRVTDRAAAQARLQREAQALAKLNHNNVVAVHDVGVHAGQLFLAMEFVAGRTLGTWMASVDEPRPWREIVRVFTEAGRGLAAAHQAGLIHRDFKPDNVMLDDDGRVRVMDFGLARVREVDEELSQADRPKPRVSQPDLEPAPNDSLTQTGSLLGTPAYMSPEQFSGKPADARSDQFGFCVALYEALYGKRPFAAKTLAQLINSVLNGEVDEAPPKSTVPTWLRKVVLRGLSLAPEDRFESMQALLDALAFDPTTRRRKWWRAAALGGLLAGGAWGLIYASQRDARVCTGMERNLEGVWDDQRRTQVQAAIEETKLSYAPGTWVRVEQRLDEYTRQWVAARSEACEATHRGEQSGELLDLRIACLDERLLHLRATVDVLAQPSEATVKKAVEAVSSLPRLERCADIEALKAKLPPPEDPGVAAQVKALDERLAQAEALKTTGQYAQALAEASAVVASAQPLDYEPLEARAWLAQGTLQRMTGAYEAAEATLVRAYQAALRLRMLDEAATASAELVILVGYRAARHEDGRRWALHAEPLAQATRSQEARAVLFNNLGLLADSEGEYKEAREYHERALAIWEELVGAEHPNTALSLNNLGLVANSEGKHEQARAYLERALAIFEEALGPEHPNVAMSLSNLGDTARLQGEYEEALRYHERALVIAERALGPDHPDVASFAANLGIVEAKEGNFERGRVHLERALSIFERTLGPKHPNVAILLENLGAVENRVGEYEAARAYQERALSIFEEALGPDHPLVAATLVELGEALLGLGDAAQAVTQLERALSMLAEKEVEPTQRAEAQFVLARALWEAPAHAGRNRARARSLAELARSVYADDGQKSAQKLEEVDAWLDELGE